jgi:RNase H-fold protein (predicted Holliday junction resolvase)
VNGPAPILGVDPGTRKCGVAVVTATGVRPLLLEIVPLEAFGARVGELIGCHGIRAIAMGSGTHTTAVSACLAGVSVPIVVVDESDTTYLARARYFLANPPTGWRRLVPRGMLLPPRPIDDFAALLIAERFLASEALR